MSREGIGGRCWADSRSVRAPPPWGGNVIRWQARTENVPSITRRIRPRKKEAEENGSLFTDRSAGLAALNPRYGSPHKHNVRLGQTPFQPIAEAARDPPHAVERARGA